MPCTPKPAASLRDCQGLLFELVTSHPNTSIIGKVVVDARQSQSSSLLYVLLVLIKIFLAPPP